MTKASHRIRLARGMVLLLAVVISVAMAEAILRITVPLTGAVQPVNDVLFLEPDARVGWTLARDFEFVWAGRNPYCVEFRIPVKTNAFGFRDGTWTINKPPGTIRIAVIGDSFVEAIQIPVEQTATHLLEQRLAERFPGRRFETMNFGVSNYSFGQYLLVYDAYVRQFKPDYVVAVAGYLNFNRTTQRAVSSVLQDFYRLEIRPSLTVDRNGRLIAAPAREYEAYARRVHDLIEREYGPDRSRPVQPMPSLLHLTTWFLRAGVSTASYLQYWRPSWGKPEFRDLALNYRILRALHEAIQDDGGVFVFADAFQHLERYGMPRGSGSMAERNESFVDALGAKYVNVSPAMSAVPPPSRFSCDMHLSSAENSQLADALVTRLAREIEPR